MIPRAAKRRLAQFVDVVTERSAFCPAETEPIVAAAAKHGLGMRAHVCQLGHTLLRPLLRFNVSSLDHLDYISDAHISQLTKHDTVATLVPGANYCRGLQNFPPARKLINS